MDFFYEANEQYSSKHYDKAIDLYKKAIKNNENISSSYYNLAVCLIKQFKYNEAIIILKKSLTLSLDSKYFFNLAYCYFQLNDYKNALRLFNLSWSLNPSDTDCQKAISIILSSYKTRK